MKTSPSTPADTELAVRLILHVAKAEGITPQAVLRAIAKTAKGGRK
jgi:hypothetical protein